MERHEVLAMNTELKLAGMRAAYDDILAKDGLKRRRLIRVQTHHRERTVVASDDACPRMSRLRYRWAFFMLS